LKNSFSIRTLLDGTAMETYILRGGKTPLNTIIALLKLCNAFVSNYYN